MHLSQTMHQSIVREICSWRCTIQGKPGNRNVIQHRVNFDPSYWNNQLVKVPACPIDPGLRLQGILRAGMGNRYLAWVALIMFSIKLPGLSCVSCDGWELCKCLREENINICNRTLACLKAFEKTKARRNAKLLTSRVASRTLRGLVKRVVRYSPVSAWGNSECRKAFLVSCSMV